MSRTAARLVLICALAGLLASSAASYVHYRMLHDPTYTSFCDVSATVSCTDAYSSRFGTFHGIPVAIFGAIWFAFATLLAVTALTARQTVADSIPGYLFAGSTLALAVVLYLAYASFVLLKVVCVLCLITYAAVLGLFLVTGSATSVPMMSLPRRAANDLKVLVSTPLAIALTVIWIGSTVGVLSLFSRDVTVSAAAAAADAAPASQASGGQSELERFMAQQPRIPLVVAAEGAKVLIVKFNDFQCPACGQSYLAYKPILEKYERSNPGAVRVVLKDYPLNPQCNANLTNMLHPAACDAAVAVRLAREKGKDVPLEDFLYTHQEQMTPESVREAARDIAQISDFQSRYDATMESVKSDIAMGKTLRVTQTPTFFINGVKIEGAIAPQLFDQAIAYELAHAK
jgi:uncharacterized membrane protein/protein-disulfide isomerase